MIETFDWEFIIPIKDSPKRMVLYDAHEHLARAVKIGLGYMNIDATMKKIEKTSRETE